MLCIGWLTSTNYIKSVGFQVGTPAAMKRNIFWNITPFSPLKGNQRFEGTYRLHLQDRRISRARNQLVTSFYAGFLLGLFFDSENGGDMFLRKVG
jgi:hypothetical protein